MGEFSGGGGSPMVFFFSFCLKGFKIEKYFNSASILFCKAIHIKV